MDIKFIFLRILVEGKRLVRSELTKLIHKRFDKLADFEVVKAGNKNVSLLYFFKYFFPKKFFVEILLRVANFSVFSYFC